jgi:hypothetical protein
MHPSLRAPVLLGPLSLAASACAPSTPAGSDDKESTVSVGMLEDMVYGHHTTFESLETLAADNGIDLESDRSADWPQSGDATVNFGQSVVGTVFTVDRLDYTRPSRTWSVSLTVNPLVAAGNNTTGEMTGIWDYWIEGDEAEENAMGWVILDLAGTIVSPDYPTGAPTTIYAVVNDNGQIYEAEIVHGDDMESIAP